MTGNFTAWDSGYTSVAASSRNTADASGPRARSGRDRRSTSPYPRPAKGDSTDDPSLDGARLMIRAWTGDDAKDETPSPHSGGPAKAGERAGARVLVVDDDPSILDTVSAILS